MSKVNEATVTCGPMADLEPGDQRSGIIPFPIVSVAETLPGWPLFARQASQGQDCQLSGVLGSQLKPQVWERTKACIVEKGSGLVAGLIDPEARSSGIAVMFCLHSKDVNHRDVQRLTMCGVWVGR